MSFDDDKSEWSMSEPQLVIPMTDGDIIITKDSDKFLSSAVVLNTLNSEDQVLLPNALENGLVIGLDRERLENINKKEVLVIQNSNLKLQPFNPASGNSAAYTLAYVDQEKNEILWESLLSKETNKSDFDGKEGLLFNESVSESPKTWQREFQESDSALLSRDKVISTSQNYEIEEKIVLAVREVSKSNSCINNILKDSFMLENYSTLQGSFVHEPNTADDLKPTESKILVIPNENFHSLNFNKTFEKGNPNTIIVKKNLPLDFRETAKDNPGKKLVAKEVLEFDIPKTGLVKNIDCESSKKENCVNKTIKETNAKVSIESNRKLLGSSTGFSLPEKSLPLKKKAKMKSTTVSMSAQKNKIPKSCLRDKIDCEDTNSTNSKPELKKSAKNDMNHSKCKSRKNKKVMKLNISKGNVSDKQKKQGKFNCQKKKRLAKTKDDDNDDDDDDDDGGGDDGTKCDVKTEKRLPSKKLENETGSNAKTSSFPFNFDESEFASIYDLVEGLRKCKVINSSLCQTLLSGLREMSVDILQEMRNKHGMQCFVDNSSYTPQLKAFALILYFKQPAAFHLLSNIYNNGWPSLNVIKEWKRRINCMKRTNFISSQREGVKV